MTGQTKVEYGTYMASREWRIRRREVIEHNDGLCYRCLSAPIKNVHHTTYERLGNERPDDLIGVCRSCHEYLSAERDDDPAVSIITEVVLRGGLTLAVPEHFGLRSWWSTVELPNGRSFCVEFTPNPMPGDTMPWAVMVPLVNGIWLHCYWT